MSHSPIAQRPRRSGKLLVFCYVALVPAIRPGANGHAAPGQGECETAGNPIAFVKGSHELVENGPARHEILETLLCIATSNDDSYPIAARAVQALFHLAQEDVVIRQYLLGVVQDGRTGTDAYATACELLVLVANDEVLRVLLEQLDRDFALNDRFSDPFQALLDLAAPQLVQWFDRTLAHLADDDPRKTYLVQREWMVRLLADPTGFEGLLLSTDDPVDLSWLAGQSVRRGVSRDVVRARIMDVVEQWKQIEGREASIHFLVRACLRIGLIDESEVRRLRLLGPRAAARAPSGIEWATLIDRKRAEFYRVPSNDTLPIIPENDSEGERK